MTLIITCNAGSTKTKLAAFNAKTLERKEHTTTQSTAEVLEWLGAIGAQGITAIGHRVVHGGREFVQPIVLNDQVVAKLHELIPLAPLHQPAALNLIAETKNFYPQAPQIACFDTAFHHMMPELERRLPLPRGFHDEGVCVTAFMDYPISVSLLLCLHMNA